MIDKFGVDNIFKIKDYIKPKLGKDNPFSQPEVQAKIRKTLKEKYGVESVLELEKRIENLKKSNIEKGINNFKNNLEENYTWIEYLGDYKHLIKCNSCETEFKCSYPQLFTYRNKLCPICYKRTAHVSSYEDEIYEYLKSILPNEEILRNYRKSLKRKELDFYIKNLNCAIEFDGTYWHMVSRFHSADEINERVHLTAQQIWNRDKEKDLIYETKNIKLLRIKEHDWLTNKENEKQKILKFLK